MVNWPHNSNRFSPIMTPKRGPLSVHPMGHLTGPSLPADETPR